MARAFALIGIGDEGRGRGRGVGPGAVRRSTTPPARPSAAELARLGVCADVSGVPVDSRGEPASAALTERMIGITAAQMRAVPEVIGIVYGLAKAPPCWRRCAAGTSTAS